MFTNHVYLIYMYKQDLALNNLQWLVCHKTKPVGAKTLRFRIQINNYVSFTWLKRRSQVEYDNIYDGMFWPKEIRQLIDHCINNDLILEYTIIHYSVHGSMIVHI